MMFQRNIFFLTTVFFVFLLTACASDGKKWNPNDYTVKSGDTVYSIAWRYELDADDFAAWNNLASSKSLKAGQRVSIHRPAGFENRSKTAKATSGKIADVQEPVARLHQPNPRQGMVRVQKGDTLYGLATRYGISVESLVQLNRLKKPYVIQPGQTIFLQPLTGSSSKPAQTSAAAGSRSGTVAAGSRRPASQAQQGETEMSWPTSIRWQRPANGNIVKKFNRQLNDAKGIHIAGKSGDPVVAAADGKVVYSGNGLISYGNLIIIKHNQTFLSAYAYNRKLTVKEGDKVNAGQKIAEMGSKDNLSPRLHFEIRKNGKPEDPLKYLPW